MSLIRCIGFEQKKISHILKEVNSRVMRLYNKLTIICFSREIVGSKSGWRSLWIIMKFKRLTLIFPIKIIIFFEFGNYIRIKPCEFKLTTVLLALFQNPLHRLKTKN
jgi:hypothetical protein